MAELTKKLNIKKDGAAAEEIKLYSTLDEVNNQGVSLKSDGINCYAAYGNASDAKASALNYKPSGSDVSYKVLKEAASTSSGDGITVKLVARRNNEDYMQDLPSVTLDPGQKFYINNANAPTIEGYDFVCCSINNFIPDKDQTINVYYIPQTVPDRTKTDWSRSPYSSSDLTGDLSLTDYANTYNATDMTALFTMATITAAPKLNMSNATNISYMFLGSHYGNAPRLTDIDARGWDVSNVTDMRNLFYGCGKYLTSLDASTWDTSNVTNMSSMFEDDNILDKFKTLKISTWDTSNVTDMSYMFRGCRYLTLDVSNFNTSKVTRMNYMFAKCNLDNITGIDTLDVSNVRYFGSIFQGLIMRDRSLDLSQWDTSNATDMSGMFWSVNIIGDNIQRIDVSCLNTSKVTDMSCMFFDCSGKVVGMEYFDASNVTDMSQMFYDYDGKGKLDLSRWNTSKVKNANKMFCKATGITELDVSNFDTSNITDMGYMFSGNYMYMALTSLDISSFNTSNVKTMESMFSYCKNLTTIVGIIDMSSCTNCKSMFDVCPNLKGVHLRNVPRSLDISKIGGTEGETYIIDNYLD